MHWQKRQISLMHRTLGFLLRERHLLIIDEQTARKYYRKMETKPPTLLSARWLNRRQRGLPMRILFNGGLPSVVSWLIRVHL